MFTFPHCTLYKEKEEEEEETRGGGEGEGEGEGVEEEEEEENRHEKIKERTRKQGLVKVEDHVIEEDIYCAVIMVCMHTILVIVRSDP